MGFSPFSSVARRVTLTSEIYTFVVLASFIDVAELVPRNLRLSFPSTRLASNSSVLDLPAETVIPVTFVISSASRAAV